MIQGDYGPLGVICEGRMAIVTIDNPPTNLVNGAFIEALDGLLDAIDAARNEVTAVVFMSADPDFFLMHGDVVMLAATPVGEHHVQTEPNRAAQAFDRVSNAGFVSIGLIDGAARGGGCEFLSALDLRYGTDRTVISQPEVALGILPGAGGTARLPRLIGRSGALEMILTGRDISCREALALGWLTGSEPSQHIHGHVLGLARRIAAMPPAAVAAVKLVVNASLQHPGDSLVAETNALGELMASGGHHRPMREFLAAGGQTREGETQRMGEIIQATFRAIAPVSVPAWATTAPPGAQMAEQPADSA